MNSAEARHAYDLDPWHPLGHLALAGFEEDPIRADFLRQYSLDRLPNEPRLCQRCLMPSVCCRKSEQNGLQYSQATQEVNWLHSHPIGVLAKAQKKVVGMAL